MKHVAHPEFWGHYRRLPPEIRDLADKNFALLRQDPHHSSVRLKRVGDLWSARVGLHYRALARDEGGALAWFWIGHHSEYERMI
jgi:hypothetical protein